MSLERARLLPRKDEQKELVKPDAFLASADKFQKWLKENQNLLIALAIVTVIGVAVFTFAANRKQSEKQTATADLSDALAFYDKTDDPTKKLSDDDWRTQAEAKFTALADKYKNSGAGRISNIYLATMATEKNDNAGAEKYYRTYLQDAGGKADLVPLVHLALANVLEDENKLDDAAGEYNKMIPTSTDKGNKDAQKVPLVDEALFGAARVAEKLGRPEEARADADRLMKDFPTSSYRQKAQALLSTLPAAPPKAEEPKDAPKGN